jgi:hypothetical protein
MAFNISTFASQLKHGGQRPSLFEVTMNIPSQGSENIDNLRFLCRATQIPPSTLTTVETTYFGRTIKFPGVKQYADWTITVINDEDWLIRNALEVWSNAINRPVENVRGQVNGKQIGFGSPGESQFKTDAVVTPYSKQSKAGGGGGKLLEYKLIGLFPTEVAAMDMDWATTDAIQEFTCTFSMDYWVYSNRFGENGELSAQPEIPPNVNIAQ